MTRETTAAREERCATTPAWVAKHGAGDDPFEALTALYVEGFRLLFGWLPRLWRRQR